MRAAIYARFSTEKQSEASIEDQFRVCERSRSARGSPLSRVFPHSIWLEENGDHFELYSAYPILVRAVPASVIATG
jgi:hypothetical protein